LGIFSIVGKMRRTFQAKIALLGAAAVASLLMLARPAAAGPPFVTDDPEPTDFGHWEIYNFASGIGIAGGPSGEAGLDLNYGGLKDVQLTATLPVAFQPRAVVGFGAVELAFKYRFLHQAEGSWAPDVAVFPRVFLPTASPQFGPSRVNFFLPMWAQKDWGKWSAFGGGGYGVNPGPGNRDYWLGGLALTRAVSDRLTLGGEIFRQTAQLQSERAFTAINAAAIYKLTDHWAVLVSGGPGVENAREDCRYDFYLSLEATY